MTGPSPRTSGAAGGGPEREGPGAGTPAAPPSALAGPPRGLESFDARGPPAGLDGDGVRRVFALSCGERWGRRLGADGGGGRSSLGVGLFERQGAHRARPHEGHARAGGGPRRWYNLWCRDCSVSPKERTGIEMKMLTEVLWFGGC